MIKTQKVFKIALATPQKRYFSVNVNDCDNEALNEGRTPKNEKKRILEYKLFHQTFPISAKTKALFVCDTLENAKKLAKLYTRNCDVVVFSGLGTNIHELVGIVDKSFTEEVYTFLPNNIKCYLSDWFIPTKIVARCEKGEYFKS